MSACLGHSPGEIYFEAYSKDAQGKYTIWTLYRTEDYGATAQVVEKNFDHNIYSDAQPGCFYKVTFGETLYFSNDTCRTWTYRTQDASNIFTTRHPGLVYIGVNYSTDYGVTWQISQNNGLPNGGNMCTSCIGFEKGEMWAYDTENFKTYRSTDYGNNFVYVDSIVPNLEAGGMFAGWQPGEVCLYNWGVVNRSVDYGHSFSYYYTAPAISYINMFGWQRGEFLGLEVKRYPHTTNTNQQILFYRTTDFYSTIDTLECNYNVGIEDNCKLLIDNGRLVNYPNPFNNSTIVNYQLSVNTIIDLAAYNNNGEFVKSLYKGQQSAGIHQITFNADDLNSGVYYIKLKYGNNLKAHKILLVK